MWDDEQIDAAIDETARQMTAVEPGADFRVRVMAQIDARRRGARLRRPALAALTVAAVMVTGIFVLREHPRPGTIASRELRLNPDATDPAKAQPPMVRLKPDPTYENNVAKANARSALEVAQGFGPAITTNDLEPLTTAAIDLDSIAIATLGDGDAIGIGPLPPAPSIAVTPLDVDNEGARQ